MLIYLECIYVLGTRTYLRDAIPWINILKISTYKDDTSKGIIIHIKKNLKNVTLNNNINESNDNSSESESSSPNSKVLIESSDSFNSLRNNLHLNLNLKDIKAIPIAQGHLLSTIENKINEIFNIVKKEFKRQKDYDQKLNEQWILLN